jgi:hypothetical protein
MKQSLTLPKSLLLLVALLAGCSTSPDERLIEFSLQANQEQSLQNALIAEQSTSLEKERETLAKTASELVEKSNANQQKLFDSFDKQFGILANERAELQLSAKELLTERQRVACKSQNEPLIAQAILSLAMLIACLTPLAFCSWVFAQISRSTDLEKDLCDFFIEDLLTPEHTRLFGASRQTCLGYQEPFQDSGQKNSDEPFPF